ncbi:MAG: PAS domain S-box protein [Bacteroidota bacterium]
MGKRKLLKYETKRKPEPIKELKQFERKVRLLESALKKSRFASKKFEALFNNTNDAIIIHDLQGNILDVNQTACERLGYQKKEILKMTPADFYTPEYAALLPRHIDELTNNNYALFETVQLCKNGKTIPTELSARTIEYDGKPAALCIARDISRRKKNEETLRTIIEGVTGDIGDKFFTSMTVQLAKSLGADCTFIGELIGGNQKAVKTVSVCVDGRIEENFRYNLDSTPCSNLLDKNACSYSSGVTKLFPEDILLKEMNVEGYVGIPLFDSKKRAIGIMVALYRKPIEETNLAEFILQIFSTRTAAEIERKHVEDALRESEEHYHLLFQRLPVGIFHYDTQLRITGYNDRFVSILQSTPERLKGLDMNMLNDKNVLPAIRQAIEGKDGLYEGFYKATTGPAEIYISLHTAPLFNQSGEITGGIGIVEDNTTKKRYENELAENEKRYRMLFDLSPSGIVLEDTNGNILDANEAFCRFTGYTKAELIGQNIRILVPAQKLQDVDKHISEIIAGKTYEHEVVDVKKDGTLCSLELHETLVSLPDGRKRILSIANDITERKQAEEDKQRFIKELTAIYDSARKLQRLYTPETLTQEFIAIMEQTLQYEFSAVLLIDEPTGELIPFAVSRQGRSAEFIETDKSYISAHQISVGKGITGWVAQTGKPVRVGDVRKDPRYYPIHEDIRSELCVPLRAGDRIIGVLNVETTKLNAYTESDQRVLETISSQMALAIQQAYLYDQIQHHTSELEARVSERTTQLQAANKELEAFAYSVSHDLRTPLRAIDGFTRILLEDYNSVLDDEGKRVCSVIRESSHRMGQLIDDLLVFSRLSRSEMRLSQIDMETLVHSIYLELTNETMRERIDFLPGEIYNATGDITMIKQVWTNLISNAIKFSSHRTRAVISITSNRENNRVIYCIKDNGAGFDMKYIKKLFEVFQRLHSAKDFEGTGVGLAIVKRVLLRHGGDVWAEGEVDKGAAFYFSLPLVKESVS